MRSTIAAIASALWLTAAGCQNGSTNADGTAAGAPTGGATSIPTMNPDLHIATGFAAQTIAWIPAAREIAALPDGDLLVGTSTSKIYIVPGADTSGAAKTAHVFINLPDNPAQGVAISPDHTAIYAATQYDVFKIPYHSGDQSEPDSAAVKIASVRTGPIAPGSDGDVHRTSSVAVTSTTVYVGVGSSCNSCVEADPTRATVQAMHLDGTGMHTIATRFRNAIALAIDPATGAFWAGGAGQDRLPYSHPFEFIDAVSLQPGSPVDYGWPDCEEDRVAYAAGADCSKVAVPRVEFPSYSTHIGAVFYPQSPSGAYAFPAAYRGSLFVSSHGSWHCCPASPPQVDDVPMNGDSPKTPANWSDPNAQWIEFMWGFGDASSTSYIGRPTGIAVGAQGSLFVADDQNNVVYRIRPK
jgi:glucose/arabinose dehydrogenase